jgi:hypothetical protein
MPGDDLYLVRQVIRNAPSVIAWRDPKPLISSASCCGEFSSIRHALPRDMTHALPSLLSEPSADSEIRLVRGPLLLATTVS